MTKILDLDDDDSKINAIASYTPGMELRSRELSETEAKTDGIALDTIEKVDLPHPSDAIDPSTVSQEISDPNLALTALKATLSFESASMGKLQKKEEEVNNQMDTIDKLLDLSASLGKLKESDAKHELSEETQKILGDLKEKGVQLIEGNPKTITKEQLSLLKSQISSRTDRARTAIQQTFARMQNIVQQMSSVTETAKQMVRDRVSEKAIQNQIAR